jgi:hypothetical protein
MNIHRCEVLIGKTVLAEHLANLAAEKQNVTDED